MNAGIVGQGASPIGMPLPLLGRPQPVPMPNAKFGPMASYPGLRAWYDVTAAGSIFQLPTGTAIATVGGTVGRLEDISGNGVHMTQATAGSRPSLISLGTTSAIRFGGTQDLGATFDGARYVNTEITMVVSLIRRGSGANVFCVGSTSSTGAVRSLAYTNNNFRFAQYNCDTTSTYNGLTIGSVNVCVVTKTAAGTITYYANNRRYNSTTPTCGGTVSTGLWLASQAGSFRGNYDLYEAALFGRCLGDDELFAIMAAQSAKWGIA